MDGTDLGPISYYTFQRVGVDHTISATFQKAQPSGDTVTLTTTANEGGTVAPAGQTRYAPRRKRRDHLHPGPRLSAGLREGQRPHRGRDGRRPTPLVMDQSYAVSAAFEKIPRRPRGDVPE